MHKSGVARHESDRNSEIIGDEPLSCTVRLEGVGGVVTVETDRERIRGNLELLAQKLGFDKPKVQKVLGFFDQRARVEFGNAYTTFFPALMFGMNLHFVLFTSS